MNYNAVLFIGMGLLHCAFGNSLGVKMGLKGEELSQQVDIPEVVEKINFDAYLQPAPISNENSSSNVNVQPTATELVPLATLIPSLLLPGVSIDLPTTSANISLNEIFSAVPSSPTTNAAKPSSLTSSTPIDPVTKLIAPYDNLSFDEAFGQAMKDLGKGKAFAWRSRLYGTCYKNDTSLPYPQCQALVDEDAKIQRAKNG